jgi:glutathione S-transferase
MALELFFHHEASPYVRRVLLLVHELAAPVQEQRVDMASADAMDAYRRINPNAKFPALRDDALVLFESNAILAHLARRFGAPHWVGSDLASVALVQQWSFWELAHWAPLTSGLTNARMGFLPLDPRPEPELEAGFARVARVLDGALARMPFVAGDEISVADLALAADLGFADEARLPIAEHGALTRWLASIRARASWQATERRKEALMAAFREASR